MKVISISTLILSLGWANVAMAEDVDLSVVNRIKNEAFNHSQVMNYVHYMADENGARLASSPDYRRAAQWAVDELQRSGINKAGLEPQSTTLIAAPLAWSSGTDGPLTAEVVYAPLWEDPNDSGQYDLVKLAERIEAYKSQYRGQLSGKIVLLHGERPFELPSTPEIQRWSEADLAQMESAREPELSNLRAWPQLQQAADSGQRTLLSEIVAEEIQQDYSHREMDLTDRLIEFLVAERVAAVMKTNTEGNGGVIFAERFGSFRSAAPVPPPAVPRRPGLDAA